MVSADSAPLIGVASRITALTNGLANISHSSGVYGSEALTQLGSEQMGEYGWSSSIKRPTSSMSTLRCKLSQRGILTNSPESPATPLLAFFLRYPNPFARHVLSVDVLSRTVNPETGQIHTTRLILKRGIIPKWAHRFLPTSSSSGGRGLDAWILEESVVDPPGWGSSDGDDEYRMQPKLSSQQGNLNHRKFMHIIEGSHLQAGPLG